MKTALITGASSGIGYELARLFAENHTHLVLVARNETKLNQLAGELTQTFKINCTVITKDLSDPASAKEIYAICLAKELSIDFLVNNAGFGDYGFFHESNWKKQQDMINVNITSLTHLTHLFLPQMVKRKFGRIMNVASMAAFEPGPLMSVYYASKGYVLSFSEALSNELQDKGITVTVLCPGPTESDFANKADLGKSKLFKRGKIASAAEVAAYGYKAMMAGKVIAIHGLLNSIIANTLRVMPKSLVRKMVRSIQEKAN